MHVIKNPVFMKFFVLPYISSIAYNYKGFLKWFTFFLAFYLNVDCFYCSIYNLEKDQTIRPLIKIKNPVATWKVLMKES